MKPMHEFGAFEAKNRFGHLLDLVENGEEVTITRHGREVARLIPARHHVNRDEARAALQRIRARAEQNSVISTGPSGKPTGTKAVVSLVLDSSATLAWIYSDETTDSIRALFDQVADEAAIVPAL
jgi:prevent-host-death family protein